MIKIKNFLLMIFHMKLKIKLFIYIFYIDSDVD